MLKRVTYLIFVLIICTMSLAFAKEENKDNSWQVLDFGEYADAQYYFNKDNIHFGRLANGEIDTNIIVYQEKKVNNTISSLQYQFYSITDGKINIENEAIKLGDETFYTRKGKLRWVDTPQYKVWMTVKPETYGYMRYQQIVAYAKAHVEELKARS